MLYKNYKFTGCQPSFTSFYILPIDHFFIHGLFSFRVALQFQNFLPCPLDDLGTILYIHHLPLLAPTPPLEWPWHHSFTSITCIHLALPTSSDLLLILVWSLRPSSSPIIPSLILISRLIQLLLIISFMIILLPAKPTKSPS